MLLIDVDDLRVDFLTLGQNVLRLADAAIRDLGDVDEAVNARMISAKAPKVMSLTILTGTTSPTAYFSINWFHGFISAVL